MATTLFINNVSTSVPGVYSAIDASALAQTGLSATGIVAILGTAQGGIPYTAAQTGSDLPRLSTPQALQNVFDSGDLLEGGLMLFDPSNDPNVLGGAQQVIACQVNGSVQASMTLPASSGNSVVLTAKKYGYGGNNINVQVSAASGGAAGSIMLTLRNVQTGALEVKDNLSDVGSLIAWINGSSNLVSAALASGNTTGALPSTGGTAQNLQGGQEKSATFQDWQNVLNLLKQVRVNSVVALSSDPAIAAALTAHCAYMCGQGRSERDGFCGIAGTNGAPPTLSQIKTATQALNTRHIRALPYQPARFDSNGNNTVFATHFLGAIAAGMQAGGGLGNSLTHKYAKVNAIYFDPSANPIDHADELIQAGAMIAERIDGVGIRFVRNVTTYQVDNNLAFIEGSVNAVVNYTAYTVRQALEFAVGKIGFAGTPNAIKAAAVGILAQLVQANILVAYLTPTVTPVADQMQVSLGVQTGIPINFVPITLHLQAAQSTAA